MTIDIRWIGKNDTRSERIWGYLYDSDYSNNKKSVGYIYVTTFWGSIKGRIYFQITKIDNHFVKNREKKLKKYSYDESYISRVIEEYEQLLVIRKLKNGQ